MRMTKKWNGFLCAGDYVERNEILLLIVISFDSARCGSRCSVVRRRSKGFLQVKDKRRD